MKKLRHNQAQRCMLLWQPKATLNLYCTEVGGSPPPRIEVYKCVKSTNQSINFKALLWNISDSGA